MRGKIGVFFPKTKLTLQDWIIMFSFFVLVVLLHAGLFFLGGGGGGKSFIPSNHDSHESF